MKLRHITFLSLTTVALHLSAAVVHTGGTPISISLQRVVPSGESNVTINSIEQWQPAQTAVIVCDMWDKHWCPYATANVARLAPALDRVLQAARTSGITIVHAPSACMDFYKDHPARTAMNKYVKLRKKEVVYSAQRLPSEEGAEWPVEFHCEGCETPEAEPSEVWTRQIETIHISDTDLISDSGAEMEAVFRQRGIKNVILCGVHTNMCIVNRSFGLRAMRRKGFNVALMRDMTDLMYDHRTWPYTTHFDGLQRMIAYIERYICPTTVSSDITGSAPFLFQEQREQSTAVLKDRARGIRLPETDYHLQAVDGFVERSPDEDYLHASEAAYEAFRDTKFSVRVHWGIYSIWQMNGESWGFQGLTDEKKAEYNELYRTWNPTGFDAAEWMNFFKRSGLQAFAFTTKHHEGFSMYDTKTRIRRRANYLDRQHPIEECDLAYSIMETPFRRDVVKELCDAAHECGIRIDLYYSHPDWYDADFRPYNGHPLTTLSVRDNTAMYGNDIDFDSTKVITAERTAEETRRMIARHREQLRELLTNYGKIDMLCFDQWLGADVWPETKATVKMVRQLQPDIMLRCRGIGNYGDYYTPEGFVPGNPENTDMPWMVIYPLGSSFSYDKEAGHYKGARWIIENLIDAVAKGGSFMVGIGPDGNGRFHPEAMSQLEETGRWLEVNGEGIYNTCARAAWKEGDVRLTQRKDGSCVYAFFKDLSAGDIELETVSAAPGTTVSLLGYAKPLAWTSTGKGVKVTLPQDLREGTELPCEHVWTLKIE